MRAWSSGSGSARRNDVEGCLQDIHWAVGSFGYFPSYALGAVIAAQLYESLRAELPGLDEQLARGEFSGLFGWLRTHVHGLGAKVPVQELLEERHRQAAVGHFLRALRRGKVSREHRQQQRRCLKRA